MTDTVFLVNPASANGSTGRAWPEIAHRAAAAGLEGETLFSEGPGGITKVAERAAGMGAKKVVVVGGDGSVNEAVNGLLQVGAGKEVEVAVVGRQIKLGAGEVFGEMALISGQPRSADVTALDYSEFAVLSGRDFRQLLRKYPDIRSQVVSLAAQREETDRQLLAEGLPPEAPRPS